MEKNIEKKLQEKYILLQLYQQNLEDLRARLTLIDTTINEIENTLITINEIKTLKEKTETMLPIGGGCYVLGTINTTNQILVNIGANIVVRKSIEDAKKFLEKKKEELSKGRMNVETQYNIIADEINKINKEIEGMQVKK